MSELRKSYTITSTLQGVDCYIRNFLADLQIDNTAKLTFTIGSLYGVKRIYFEKQSSNGWISLQTIKAGLDVVYSYVDNQLQNGVNNYRGKIELTNDSFIYSDIVPVYYWGSNEFIIFPNPVFNNNNQIQLLSKNPEPRTVKIYNVSGLLILTKEIKNPIESIQLNNYPGGTYFFTITERGNNVVFSKMIIIL